MTAAPAGLVAQLASAEALRRAWVEVQANDAEDGELAPSVRRFAGDVDANLARLSSELTGGEYRPRPLTEVMVTTGSGKQRALHVPVAEDRIVERAALDVLTPLVDPHLAPSSYGYRPGLGVGDAVRALVGLRAEGLGWVARADIDDCFPSIDRHRVLYRLGELVPDEGLVGLVTSLLMRPVRTSWGLARPDRGLPQGSPLSPLLSNVVLDRFDRAVLADGFPLVRYGDDMVIAAESSDEAHTALVAAGDAADDVGLRLGEDKSEVASFDEGFFFLGEEFNGRYPPDDPTARRDEPDRRTLYVGVQGAGVRVAEGRLLVERDDAELLSVPQGQVARLVLAGSVGLSAGARSWALYSAIDVVLLSRRGSFLGWLDSSGLRNVQQRRAQYAATGDDERRVEVGRRVVGGKLANQAALLLRYARRASGAEATEAAGEIDRYAAQLPQANTVGELMGLEGIASRRYFAAVATLLPVEFPGRQRNPPPDVVNAALSYGYAVLLGEAVSSCASAGLDPGAGFLHGDDARRPSLALDLMEEFRPHIVDTAVLELVRRGHLDSGDVRPDPHRPGVLLTEAARRRLLAALEDRLLSVAHHTPSGLRLTRRRHIYAQGAQLARCVSDTTYQYEPARWR